MLSNGLFVGVIHLDTTSSEADFRDEDRDLLSLMANTMGPAIRAGGLGSLPPLPTVFISYAHGDRNFVSQLANDLRRRRVRVWLDQRLKAGEDWRRQLAAAIKGTNAFVLVMSPQATASEHVLWELNTAQSMGKKVFSLMYQDSAAPLTILPLQHHIHIGVDYTAALDELVKMLYELESPALKGKWEVEPGGIDGSRAVVEVGWEQEERATPQPEVVPSASSLSILHLSDLHFGTEENAVNWFSQLDDDLRRELGCERLNALVVSGDIANFVPRQNTRRLGASWNY